MDSNNQKSLILLKTIMGILEGVNSFVSMKAESF